MTGGQGQPEADLGAGREALGVREREADAPEGALPHAGHVAMACPPDLAQLREPEPDLHDDLRDNNVTGTAPPEARSWPVPWLPPAGGVADATTCSMP